MYTDAHIHLADFATISGITPIIEQDSLLCASAHNKQEFLWQEQFAKKNPEQVFLSFGIHPQKPEITELSFLEDLVLSKRISAIGEVGFDLYSKEFSEQVEAQKDVWNIQLDLAIRSQLPIVIHCRKALSFLFADSKKLALLPSVIFHGWSGSAVEAQSFLSRGVSAFFCSGKSVLRGDRSLRETLTAIPISHVLTETDAPYMTRKNEVFSSPSDIADVASQTALVTGFSVEEFTTIVKENFKRAFGLGL